MPILTKFVVANSRIAASWVANPYRVHQRLLMAYEGEERLLFRIEQARQQTVILAQSNRLPNWHAAFDDFAVLQAAPESKEIKWAFEPDQLYRFRLLANPTVTREGKRLGLLKEEDQLAWIERQMHKAGAKLLGCQVRCNGLQKSGKNPTKQENEQTHLSVLFDGVLQVVDAKHLAEMGLHGVGPAKGYGFGLVSMARY